MVNFWLKLTPPIIGLAPMDGVTDQPMRQIQCQIAKPDVIYTEFISADGLWRRPDRLAKKLAFTSLQQPIVAQLFGAHPEAFAQAASIIHRLGFDGLDINMGCPTKRLSAQGGGANLIGNYALVDQIITACLKTKVSLSIKTRVASDEKSTLEWITFLSRYPLAALCLHGRPINQRHAGPVNWPLIAQAAQIAHKTKIIFLGNGGIKSHSEAIVMCQRYQLDGSLIGQAALGNPWVFGHHPPSVADVSQTLLAHARLAYAFYGPKGFPATRKHFLRYLKRLPPSLATPVFKSAILSAPTPEELAQILVK
jgi:tRNA-dihydrouridine synthase